MARRPIWPAARANGRSALVGSLHRAHAAIPVSIGTRLAALIGVRFLLGAARPSCTPLPINSCRDGSHAGTRGRQRSDFCRRWRGFRPHRLFWCVHDGAPRLALSFWVCALIGAVAGVVWYLAARDTPEQHPRVSPVELTKIHSGLTLGLPTDRIAGAKSPWRRILTSADIWLLSGSYFCYGYVAWIFLPGFTDT